MKDNNETDNEQVAQRRAKLNTLRESGNPFPNDFRRDSEAAVLLEKFGGQENEALEADPKEVRIAGRLMTRRVMGKAAFAHVRDESGDIQIYAQRDALPEGVYNDVFKKLDIGDIVGVSGVLFKTRTGELTVNVREFRLLVKSLHPLPEKYHGLTDIETRYRRRYVDLLVNQESREVFRKRAATITALRRFSTVGATWKSSHPSCSRSRGERMPAPSSPTIMLSMLISIFVSPRNSPSNGAWWAGLRKSMN